MRETKRAPNVQDDFLDELVALVLMCPAGRCEDETPSKSPIGRKKPPQGEPLRPEPIGRALRGEFSSVRDYAKIAPSFWTGGTGRSLRGDAQGQVIAAYLMTCPSANMIGLYYLPLPVVAHETGITVTAVADTLSRLTTLGFAVYDIDAEYVFVPQMACYQIGDSLKATDNRRIAVIRSLEQVTHGEFRSLFLERYSSAYNLSVPAYPKGKSHERIARATLEALWVRDNGSCRGCGVVGDPSQRGYGTLAGLQADHIRAKILGGKTDLANLQILCPSCNAKKSAADRKSFWDAVLSNDAFDSSVPVPDPSGRGLGPPSDPLRSQDQDQDQEQERSCVSDLGSSPSLTPPQDHHSGVRPVASVAANATADGAFGMTVDSWADGISSVTGGSFPAPRGKAAGGLAEFLRKEWAKRNDPALDPCQHAFDEGASYVRANPGKTYDRFDYERWAGSGRTDRSLARPIASVDLMRGADYRAAEREVMAKFSATGTPGAKP